MKCALRKQGDRVVAEFHHDDRENVTVTLGSLQNIARLDDRLERIKDAGWELDDPGHIMDRYGILEDPFEAYADVLEWRTAPHR